MTAERVGEAPASGIAPTLIYDADCGFCRKWVSRVKRWDRRNVVETLPLDDPRATALSRRSIEQLRHAAHFVRPDGAVFAGAAAASELFRYLPGGWFPHLVMRFPGVLSAAERAYRWVARKWGPVS